MNALEIRNKFIEFFNERNHRVISGASLIPENDPSVLFTTAGMHPLVPYLLGEPHPLGKRLVDYQKCLRTDDIDEVGDDTHVTFFEMLGNWSLGDYFKEEAIRMSYDFLVNCLKLDPERLSVSVFSGDQDAARDVEAAEVWRSLGVKEENIYYYGKKHNWWGPAGVTGPCGPDTEIFYDTLKPRCSKGCGPSCDCGKYWEIWNNVFMEYYKDSEGNFTPLKQKNVDTGLGLERVTALMEHKDNIYETKLFSEVMEEIKLLSNKKDEVSFRIIADHIRAACFIITDGVLPGNMDQSYILRRLIRRAVRYMRKLEINPDNICRLATVVINSLRHMYGELEKNEENIINILQEEKDKFMTTLEKGEARLYKILEGLKKENINILNAKTVFNLYDTYGFPPEITGELAKENGVEIDLQGFKELFKNHQELSRQGAAEKFKGGLADDTSETIALHTATHLLHRALQLVLGEHAKQKGSNITKERLRFDFTHGQKLTSQELKTVEDIVNNAIKRSMSITCEEIPYEKAKESGAEGLFANKYGEVVKVYTIGDFSKEICGGPHVENTSELGYFKIVKEESVASGVRRIKAVLLRDRD
ncbi:alanine--tRNA ligase [Desnuesiella massiliensis]|uniref:alanine--tRNA ligase n=1 Tax=Desnuesiella massiliensis TaxID=1650662 RepID=UPI0006E3CE1A|nr:alanine--tRNA ligase [Desnuesiella massiliensis]